MSAAIDSTQLQVAADDEEETEFVPVDQLAAQGINAGDVKKLKEAGFMTVQAITMNTTRTLTNVKGLSEAKVEKIVEAATKLLPEYGFVSGTMALQRRKSTVLHITTGCEALNQILGGGVETQSITELFGEYRTGKTQICHTLCVTCQLPTEMGGGAGKAAYIDTEGTFRPEKVAAIADRFGLDAEAVLDNILVARAFTYEMQLNLIAAVAAKMVEEPFKMLIIDSIMGLLKHDFTGRGELSERQQILGQMLSKLKKLAYEFNLAIVITNQVISDPSGGAVFVSDPKKPIGGHVLAHAVTHRISLRKGKGEQRIAKLVDSPALAEADASFCISEGGVQEYKD